MKRESLVFVAAVALMSPMIGASGGHATSEEQASYVILANDAGSVDAAVQSVKSSGGSVLRVNRSIGLVTASSNDASFATALVTKASVAGVARDTVIGKAPSDALSRSKNVEQEGRLSEAVAASQAAAKHGDDEGDEDKRPEPLAGMQWDMRMIGATPDKSYEEQPGKKDVLVGVIDTGIDGTHPDIAPNFNAKLSRNFTVDIPLIDGDCALEADQSCNDANNVDEDGHGTHVAGTIASPINGIGMAGVAPNVTLVNLRAGQDSGYFFLGATVDALTYAGDNGIDVVNMSFYVDPWLFNCRSNPADSAAEQNEQATIIDATQRALKYARDRGVTLVSALGNEHTDLGLATKLDETSPDFPPDTAKPRDVGNDCINIPAESDGVISVSSVGPSTKKADYSNHGNEQNDISAPGGFFRDFIGTPQNRMPENLILGPYPKNVALAAEAVDPVTGASLSPFVIAECSAPTIDACSYWQLIQGTSMAAPHAAGVAALIVSKYGDKDKKRGGRTLAPAKVERILYATATKVACPAPVITYAAEGRSPDFDAPCVGTASKNSISSKNSIYGNGIVNANRAVH
jgi:lantibiotic leader peptide-processing serine protease